MPTMQLNSVVNPGNNDRLVVERDSSPPPSPRDVGSGEAIESGDNIYAVESSSAVLDNVTSSAEIVSMDGNDPVTVEINWEEVGQVEEYYNTTNGRYDYILTTTDDEVVTIRG